MADLEVPFLELWFMLAFSIAPLEVVVHGDDYQADGAADTENGDNDVENDLTCDVIGLCCAFIRLQLFTLILRVHYEPLFLVNTRVAD